LAEMPELNGGMNISLGGEGGGNEKTIRNWTKKTGQGKAHFDCQTGSFKKEREQKGCCRGRTQKKENDRIKKREQDNAGSRSQ